MTAQSAFIFLLHQKMREQRNINEMILRLTNMKDGKDANFTSFTDEYEKSLSREVLDDMLESDTTFITSTNIELDKAITRYENGDFQTAVPTFIKFSEEGGTKARYYLARCYYYGQGVKKNYSTAVDLLAQNNGITLADANSHFLLSRCYRYGKGETTNYEKADSLVIEAACRGLNEAIELLQIEKEMSRNDILDWLISILNDKMARIRTLEENLQQNIPNEAPTFGLG